MAAGLAACVGTLTALHARGVDGPGQVVRVDVAETAAAMCFPYVVQHLYNGTERRRSDLAVPAGQVECRDGWVCIWIYNHRWKAVLGALGLGELEADPRVAEPTVRRRNWAELFALIQERVRGLAAEEVVEALQAAQVIAAKSYRPSELGRARHLRERGYWGEADGRPVLGPPWRLERTPRRAPRPAPEIGAHGRLPMAARPAPGGRAPAEALGGLRVVELTTAWAGPMAGRVLAYFGAESIHVESPNRVNSWRLHHETPNPVNFPGGEPGARPFDRSFLFNSQNVNKLSCIVDLKSDEGRSVLTALAERSDVLICNFRPGTLAKFGLDHATLAARNPGIIVCEMPAFGTTGPMARHAALGPTMEMAAGMSALIGYPGGPPETTGPSYMDPVGGLNAAAAILTALIWRQRSGEGQAIELPQVEAAMQLIGPQILEALETGAEPARAGNRRPDAAPHDAFPAAGEDQWLAIAVFDDAGWRRLCAVIGREEMAGDPRFATLAARKANEDALTAEVAAWSRRQDKHAAAARLQDAGVAAAPVATPRDLAESAYLAARGFFAEIEHADAGRHRYPGLPMHLGRTPGGPRRPAPTFGQDNLRVLTDILAMDEAAVARLQRTAGMTDVPLPGA
jgi:crotonobetainyl-CoA:carnitine CoA-transferase CaiB-like acyl-CoA transferase